MKLVLNAPIVCLGRMAFRRIYFIIIIIYSFYLGEARAGGTQQQQNFEVAKHGRADQYEIRDGEPEALHVREARVLKGYVEEQEHKEWLAEESSVLWMTATQKGKA